MAAAGNGLPQNIAEQIRQQEQKLLIAGQRLGQFDKIRQREFYSEYLFAPGLGGVIPAGNYPVFVAVEGDMGQGWGDAMTLRETNWPQRTRIADNFNLVVKAFHVSIRRSPQDQDAYPTGTTFGVDPGDVDTNVPPHPTDVARIAYGMQLGIKYLTNVVPIGLIADYPSPGDAHGWNQEGRQLPSATAGLDATPNASADTRGYLPVTLNATVPALERRAKVATLLQHGEQFNMVLIVSEAITLLGPNAAADADPQQNDASGAVGVRVSFWATESFVERS